MGQVQGVDGAACSRLPPPAEHQEDPGVDENPRHEADDGHGGQDGGLLRLEQRLVFDRLESQTLVGRQIYFFTHCGLKLNVLLFSDCGSKVGALDYGFKGPAFDSCWEPGL